MKTRINITLEKELHKTLKRKRVNVSSYVEKVIINDIISKQNASETHVSYPFILNPVLCIISFRKVK